MPALPRQKLLPFFLPMSGCPHRCVYCDQWVITGQQQPPDPEAVRSALAGFSGGPGAELAYYGGSFTCLPRETQAAYLNLARPALAAGKLSGVRISTRPDAVDEETCRFLTEQGVTTVELGIQSFSDPVLTAVGRGYAAETAREACLRLRRWGFRLGIQLMTGLPGDTPRQCRDSLRQSLDLVPALLRFYPTLVLKNTALARLYRAGAYLPQSLAEAAALCGDLLALARAAGVPVQRIGLNPSPELEKALVAGPYHPAFGGLVREGLRLAQARALLGDCDPNLPAVLAFPSRETPLILGQRRAGAKALAREYPRLTLTPDDGLAPGTLVWRQDGKQGRLTEKAYCRERRDALAKEDEE